MKGNGALILCIYELLIGALLVVFGGGAGAAVGGLLIGHGAFLISTVVRAHNDR